MLQINAQVHEGEGKVTQHDKTKQKQQTLVSKVLPCANLCTL